MYSDHKEKQHTDYDKLLFRYGKQYFEIFIVKLPVRSRFSLERLLPSACKVPCEMTEHIVYIVKSASELALFRSFIRSIFFIYGIIRNVFKYLRRPD